jgi:hypothetical protein
MAFDPDSLDLALQPMGGEFKIASYQTSDALATVTASGYFTDCADYGLGLETLVVVLGEPGENTASYIGRIDSISAAGHGTLVVDDSDATDLTSVLSYGADPTGVADSRAAFVAAIAYANTSKRMVVNVPGGTYLINTDGGTIDIPEGVAVRGAGTGFQVRAPSVSKQGTTFHITGTTNSPFGLNRGSGMEGFSIFYPNQMTEAQLASNDPVEYPYFIIPGTVGSGLGRSYVRNVRGINVDKFIRSGLETGNPATEVVGGNLFLHNVVGCFYREFICQQNTASWSHFQDCILSAVYNPDASTNTQAWQGANLIAFKLVGQIDGFDAEGFKAFNINRVISHSNPFTSDVQLRH